MTRATVKKYRQHLHNIYKDRYVRHFLDEGYYCFYCGDPATGLDHMPPLFYMDSLSLGYIKKNKISCALLPCCTECNLKGGNKMHLTVMDRLLFLESTYEKHFKKMKSLWSADEIDELGPSLRSFVIAKQEKINRYIDKIRNIQKRMTRSDTFPEYLEEIQG